MSEYFELERILGRTIKREEKKDIIYYSWKNLYQVKSPEIFNELKKKLKIRHCPRDNNGKEFFKFKDGEGIESKIAAFY